MSFTFNDSFFYFFKSCLDLFSNTFILIVLSFSIMISVVNLSEHSFGHLEIVVSS